jgi:hypothetical protein
MSTKILTAVAILLVGYVVGRMSAGPVAAQAPATSSTGARVYELRTYTAHDGKLANVNARFRDHTKRIFEKHGMKSVGYWTPLEGPTAGTTLVYILEHQSREAARASWAAFRTDPDWLKAKAESEAAGPIVAKVESVFLSPTDYSALK